MGLEPEPIRGEPVDMVDMDADENPESWLRGLATVPDDAIDLGEAELLLAACDRGRVALGRYRDHLATLTEETGAAAMVDDPIRSEERPVGKESVRPCRYRGA